MAVDGALRELPDALFDDCFPLTHSFGDGVYVREILMPKGALIVGKIHKYDHPAFLLEGECSVLTERGTEKLKAPCYFITPRGTKRVFYIHEDVKLVTVHATEETEIDKIEDEIIAKTYDELSLPVTQMGVLQ